MLANARLIAAAPDLLAALENMPTPLSPSQAADRIGLLDWHEDTYRRWYDGPRAAALAKAKGKA